MKQQHQQHVDFLRHQIERKQAKAAAAQHELDQVDTPPPPPAST